MKAILTDRATQFVMAASGGQFDDAAARLQRAALHLVLPNDLDQAHEAIVLTAAACGLRMFQGGVFVSPDILIRTSAGQTRAQPLLRRLADMGVQTTTPPAHARHLIVGQGGEYPGDLVVWVSGWTAWTAPPGARAVTQEASAGNVLAGVAAGALGITEIFRRHVLDDLTACRRSQALDLWGPDSTAPEAQISVLPRDLWLIGLGNLGQATLFALDLLPWADTAEVTLVLNDSDRVGPENLNVQILSEPRWVGTRKARMAADWADARGFNTVIEERRFAEGSVPSTSEPRIALVGVDNLKARRAVANAGFDLVIDAGLGATGSEAFDLRLHAFPGSQIGDSVWPEIQVVQPTSLPQNLAALIDQGRLDACGAFTIAGASVGVPCTALAAAALQLAQLCRALAQGRCADRIDISLQDLGRAHWRLMPQAIPNALAKLNAV